MEYYEKALRCSGVPSTGSGQAPTQVCIAGDGFVQSDMQRPRPGGNDPRMLFIRRTNSIRRNGRAMGNAVLKIKSSDSPKSVDIPIRHPRTQSLESMKRGTKE